MTDLRRTPQQARSGARVTRILDAAAAALDAGGYHRFTTKDVAIRAEMSIGSIYRYFPDGRSLARALAERNLERFAERVLLGLADRGDDADWWDTVDVAIDVFVAMHHDEPGFRALRFGDLIDQTLIDDERTNNALIGELLLGVGEGVLGVTRSPDLELAVDVAVEVTDALLKRAFRDDARGDPRFVEACRHLVHGHLSAILGEARRPPRRA